MSALDLVARSTRRLDDAKRSQEQRIIEAHHAGLSLREIAAAAGISHQQVSRIINNESNDTQ